MAQKKKKRRGHATGPQIRWANKQQTMGNCRICAQPRGDSGSKLYCLEHKIKHAIHVKNHRTRKKALNVNANPPAVDGRSSR